MSATIELTKGRQAIVDNDRLLELLQWRWCLSANGYAVRRSGAQIIFLHKYIAGASDGIQVDHINGNRLDNRAENLRLCTPQQNTWNSKKRIGGTSKHKGVCKLSRKDYQNVPWRAAIKKDGKSYFIGYFSTEAEAAQAYNKQAVVLFGDFARLNEV